MRSMATCFEIMLGKFRVQPLLEADSTFGPIFYVIYNTFIIFVLLTVFISIINDSFKIVRERSKKQNYGMFDYIQDFILARKIENTRKCDGEVNENQQIYKDQIEYLGDKVDDL